MAVNKRIEVGVDVKTNVDKNSLNNLKNSLNEIKNMTLVDFSNLNPKLNLSQAKTELEKIKNEAIQVEYALNAAFNSQIGTLNTTAFEQSLGKVKLSLDTIYKDFSSAGVAGESAFRKIASQLTTVNYQFKQSNKLIDEMKTSFANTVKWGISSSVFNTLTNSLQQSFNYAVKLDSVLTDIRIVSEATSEDMEHFAVQANKAAQRLGASTKDYAEASLIYYQQGLGAEESARRAEITLKAANVTGQSAQDVSEQLTAVWNGYNVELSETELYVDKLAAVAASTAADLEELSTGMGKVASAANAMGVDIDSLNAQLATIVSVTRQAPESVGTALRTIYARMGDIEAGTDEETTLGNYTAQMKALGVNVLDVDGKLRDMGDVITEVGNNWNNMSREQQIALAQVMAGTRQYNNLLALFGNWDMYNEALETSQNAMGTLQEQQDKYMQSTSAHLETLGAAIERIQSDFIDTEGLNDLIDLVTELTNLFGNFIEAIGGSKSALLLFGSIATRVFKDMISSGLANFINNIDKTNKNLEELTNKIAMNEALKNTKAYSNSNVIKGFANRNSEIFQYADIISNEDLANIQKLNDQIAEAEEAQAKWNEQLSQTKQYIQQVAENSGEAVPGHQKGYSWESFFNEDNWKEGVSLGVKSNMGLLSSSSKDINKVQKQIQNITNAGIDNADEFREVWEDAFETIEKKVDLFANTTEGKLSGIAGVSKSTREQIYKIWNDKDTGLANQSEALFEAFLSPDGKEQTQLRGQLGNLVKLLSDATQEGAQKGSQALVLLDKNYAEIENEVDILKNKVKDLTSLYEYQLKAFKTQFIINGLTEITSGIMNLAVSIQAVQNLGSIWNNEDLTTGEKILQTVMALAMALQGLTAILSIYNGLKGISTVVTEADTVATIKNTIAKIAAKIASGDLTTVILLAVAATAALIAGTIALTKAILENISAEARIQKEIERTSEAFKEAREAYQELNDTISAYDDARSKIDDLTEGTVEFYEAIMDANEEAKKLIETWKLVSGKDYTLDGNGLININQDVIDQKSFEAQQAEYQAQAANLEAENDKIRLERVKILREFQKNVNRELTDENAGYRLSSLDLAEKMLKGQEATQEEIANGTRYANSIDNMMNLLSNIKMNRIQEQLGDIQTSVDDAKAELALQDSKAKNQELMIADALIRGYGSRDEIETYSQSTADAKKVIQEYVGQAVEANKGKSEDVTLLGEMAKYTGTGGILGSLFGIAPIGIGVGLSVAPVTYSMKKDQLSNYYKSLYAQNAQGYTIDNETGTITDSLGNTLDQKEWEAVLEQIDETTARKVFERGEYVAKSALAQINDELETERVNIAGVLNENGETRFSKTSQGYIANALLSARYGLDYDYGNLNEEELQYAQEQGRKQLEEMQNYAEQNSLTIKPEVIENFNKLFEAQADVANRAALDLKDFNSTLEEQAEALETTSTALKLYGYALEKSGDLSKERNKETAEEIAASYKFNKAYNEAADLYEDNEDAFKAYIKALKNGKNVSYDVADATGEVVEKLQEMFGFDFSPEFLEENAKDIKILLTGTAKEAEEAYERIRRLGVGEALASAFELDPEKLTTVQQDLFNAIADLKPGDALSENFSNALIDMVNNAHMSTEELTNLFNALDLEIPEVNTENLPEPTTADIEIPKQTTRHYYHGYYPVPNILGGVTPKEVNYWWDETTEPTNYAYIKWDKDKTNPIKRNATSKGSNASRVSNFTRSQSSSGSNDKPKQEDLIDEQADRYHKIDTQITKVNNSLSLVESQQEKLFGSDLIKNLNKQWELLNDQINNYNIKLKIAQSEQDQLRAELAKQGVAFNADGTISNYMSAFQAQEDYVNGLIEQYNKLSAKQQEAWDEAGTLDIAKENFDTFKENMDRYDELVSDFIPQLKQNIQDAIDKQIDIQIEEFNKEIEIRLDMAEAERDWNEFKKRVIDGIKDDDILGTAKARLQDFSTYYNDAATGVVQASTKHIQDILSELRIMDQGGAAKIYGDGINAANNNRQQALDDLQTYYDQLKDDLNGVLDLQEEIHQAYLDEMDEVQDKFNEQLDMYETLRDLIEHDMNVIQMVYGEEAYGQLADYYERQKENYNSELDFLRQQKDFWYAQMQAAEEGTEEWEKARDNWLEAVDDWNAKVEDAIQNLQDKYLNAINKIFQDLNDQVTDGKGLKYVEEEWKLINKNAEQYLDTVDATWGIQKLENKYMDAYDATDSINARRQIKEIMDEELANLREQDKLTQYDIDRANMRYDIMLKQIALQEAQQNKSRMRLRRDSQGNYTYQFVADDEEIGNLQDELGDLYNSLYDFDKEHYEDNLNQLYDIWVEFQEKMAEAAQINDPVKRAEMELLIRQQYEPLLNGILQENLDIRANLQQSAFDDLAYLYDEDVNNFLNMSETEKDEIMNGLVPTWESGLRDMADAMIGEGGFEPTVRDAMDRLEDKTQEYEDELGVLQEVSGQVFGDMAQNIDDNIEKTKELIKENQDLIETQGDELDAVKAVRDAIDNLIDKYNASFKAATNATTAAHDYFAQVKEQAADAASYVDKVRKAFDDLSSYADEINAKINTVANNSSKLKVTSGGGDGGGKDTIVTSPSPSTPTTTQDTSGSLVGQYATVIYGNLKNLKLDSSGIAPGVWPNGTWLNGEKMGVKITNYKSGAPYPYQIAWPNMLYKKWSNFGWVKKSALSGLTSKSVIPFDTGGYTGQWGNNGRLALLHQKELVLNSTDTQNILNAVSVMRTLGGAMLNRLSAVAANSNTGSLDNAFEQNVHIEATFPNVQSSHEIEDAIDNLMNIASQRIGHKVR